MKTHEPITLPAAEFWQLLALANARTIADRDAQLALIALNAARASCASTSRQERDVIARLAQVHGFDTDAVLRLDDRALTIQPLNGDQ